MNTEWTPDKLEAFSRRVADAFNSKLILSPVHLCSTGQATPLIEIFSNVQTQDWICCSWRNSYHCLLKGMPEEELFQEILAGRSMHIMSRQHRILCSSIVGGVLPIALGIAAGIKRDGGHEQVWCFMGDMTICTGQAGETIRYASGHRLPIRFVLEDNGYSTDTPTADAWGIMRGHVVDVTEYQYERQWPHVGTGTYVSF